MPGPFPRSNLLFSCGGDVLLKYGTFARRLTIPARGGDLWKETVARNLAAAYMGRDGLYHYAGPNVLRGEWFDLNGDGILETFGTLHEPLNSNLVKDSENFGSANWVVGGTAPTLTPAQADPFGGTAAYLIADTSAAGFQYLIGAVNAIAIAGVKPVSLFVKKGTAPAPSGAHLFLFDNTAAQNRLDGILTFTGAGVPQLAMTTGTYLGATPVLGAPGWYRIFFQTTACTLGNVHNYQIIPAQVAAETGNLFVFGAMFGDSYNNENVSPYWTSYVKTAGATVTRPADLVTVPWTQAARAIALYARFVDLGCTQVASSGLGILQLGNTFQNGWLFLDAPLQPNITHEEVAASVFGIPGGHAFAYQSIVEIGGIMFPDGSVQGFRALNGGAEVASARSVPVGPSAFWNPQTLYVGQGASFRSGPFALLSAKLMLGVEEGLIASLADMRTVAV